MQVDARRTARLALAWLVAMLACFAVPAIASADSVDVHIESQFNGTLVPHTTVALASTSITPTGAPDGVTCPGNSVVAVVDAATNGSWTPAWDGSTLSIAAIKGSQALLPDRKWVVIVDGALMSGSPCQMTLKDGDYVTLAPACLGSTTTKCFSSGILYLTVQPTGGPGAPVHVAVNEVTWSLDSSGNGYSSEGPSLNAAVTGPDGYVLTDSYYGTGTAVLQIAEKGPASIVATKNGFAPDQGSTCITDGGDGYCGTPVPTQNPFNPLDYCQTTGSDGYCGSPDHVPPVGRIGTPLQGRTYAAGAHPLKFAGTVDFDPSLTDHVNLRLMRQIKITVKRYKKRRVWVTRKIHGKRVRKRVTKRIARKVKQTACYYWSDGTSTFIRMKKCDPTRAQQFQAAGAEVWTYEFLSALPAGAYTLDVLAVDGAGNVDSTPELGRNRITFTDK